MSISLISNDQNNIKEVLKILQQYSFDELQLDIHLSPLEKDKKSILQKLEKLGVEFTFNDEMNQTSISDFEDESELNSSVMDNSTRLKKEEINNFISWELKDRFLYHFFKKSRDECNSLYDWAENNQVSIVPDFDLEMLSLKGPKKAIEEFKETTNVISYEKSALLNEEEAWGLDKTNFIKGLKSEYNIKIRIVPEISNKKQYSLVIYGEGKEVQKCRDIINESAGKLIKLLETSKKYQQSNESEKILEYLTKVYTHKCEAIFKKYPNDYQFIKVESCYSSRYTYFLFLNCEQNHFEKARKFIQEEIQTLCILNLNGKGLNLKCNEISTSEIFVTKLEDRSYLLLGKAKYFKNYFRDQLASKDFLKNVFKCRFRVQKFNKAFIDKHKINIESFIGGKMIQTEEKVDFKMFVFVIRSQFQVILKIFENFLDLKKLESNENDEKDAMQEKIKNSPTKEVGMKPKTSPKIFQSKENLFDEVEIISTQVQNLYSFPEENSYNLQFDCNEEILELDDGDLQYKKISQLLTKNSPKISIQNISKIYNQDQWAQYLESKQKQKDNESIKEYIMFFESTEEPIKVLSDKIDLSTLKDCLINSFDPEKNKCHKQKEENKFCIFAFSVLVDERTKETIIDYYPAYFIIFQII